MTSFYGGKSGIVGQKPIQLAVDGTENGINIVVSDTQPQDQQEGDLWFVIEENS